MFERVKQNIRYLRQKREKRVTINRPMYRLEQKRTGFNEHQSRIVHFNPTLIYKSLQ